MPAGRPEEYKEEYISKVDEYIKENQDEYEEYHKTRGDKSDTFERIIKVKLPSVEGFAYYLDVSKKSLYNWSKEYPEFLHALGKIEKEQQKRLINGGLSGEYNSTIAKLILSANHGMREKTDITSDNKVLPQPIYGGASTKIQGHDSNEEDI